MRMRRPALPAVLAVLASAAFGLTAASCGSDDLNPEAVAQAAEKTGGADSLRFRMEMEVAGELVTAEGFTSSDPIQVEMTMTMPGVEGDVDAVVDGEIAYYRFPAEITAGLGAEDAEWVSMDLGAIDPALGAAASGQLGSSDPTAQLDLLLGMGDIEESGEEEIDGTQTTKYSGTLDLRAALDRADGEARAALERTVEEYERLTGGEAEIPAEVWVDSNDLIRRMTMEIEGGGQTVEVTMDLFDYGAEEDVEVPSGDEVVDVTEQLAAATPTAP